MELGSVELIEGNGGLKNQWAGLAQNVSVRQNRRGSVGHIISVGKIRTSGPLACFRVKDRSVSGASAVRSHRKDRSFRPQQGRTGFLSSADREIHDRAS